MLLVTQYNYPHRNAMGFTLKEYLQPIDWSGRVAKSGKRVAISEEASPILQRIGLEPLRFIEHMQGHAATEHQTVMEQFQKIRLAAETLGRRFLKGGSEARRLYVVTSLTGLHLVCSGVVWKCLKMGCHMPSPMLSHSYIALFVVFLNSRLVAVATL
jgi:hypothetical protein